ncbi:MAG TPA: RcnB family protein [Herbaspirillum sp.]|jgi:Ni/Co efflux regulator RcnB
MKIKTVVSAALALSLLSSGFAFADDHRGGPSYRDHGNPHDRNDHRNDHRDYHDERGAGPSHSFRRGDRLPVQYRSRQYVVDDWRGHHLSAPPRGYHWVQTGGDYVLVAVSTGIILNFLLGN